MIKGLYTAASGMINMLSANDTIANNLANINTPGFKQGVTVFKAFAPILLNKIAAHGNQKNHPGAPVGAIQNGSNLHSINTDYTQGEIKKTDNKYDMAIQGDGFFEVETQNGERLYTRDGAFDRSMDGYLVTRDGNKVIGADNKPIKFEDTQLNFHVLSDGSIMANKEPLNKIKLVEFDNKLGLIKRGNNLHVDPGAASPKLAKSSRIIQGALEGSNANVIKTMVKSIEGMRTYESLATILENVNRNLEKASSQLGKYS